MSVESAYVDTGILGAYYCAEAQSDAAEAAMAAVDRLLISPLSDVEFCSMIARKQRLGELSAREARERLALWRSHVAAGAFTRVSLDASHYVRATELLASFTSTLRTLDALHLALTLDVGVPLLTADRSFAAAARQHGAEVLLVN